ncbi:MAG: hypothetical protein NTV80_16000 [Verrucomicrobia bacterium]|nr:hypothetical protein [Verrucomicrobiota bacterium]
MIEAEILKEKFRSLNEAMRKVWQQRFAILCYLILSASLLVLAINPDWLPKAQQSQLMPTVIISFLVIVVLSWLLFRRNVNSLEIARSLESRDSNLKGLAITATELLHKTEPSFLDYRVISQFTDYSATKDWKKQLLGWHEKVWATPFLIISFMMLVFSFKFAEHSIISYHRSLSTAQVAAAHPNSPQLSATLTPGDTEIERGSRLVVEAAFAKEVPADATLIISELDGKERDRIPMRLTVDEQVFGGMIAKVDKDARYHVEFGDGKSKQHTITTFVYPKLEQVDVKITPPAYTKLPSKEIKNTMKITAMEDSTVDFSLKINKPVKEAELFGEDKTVIKLVPSAKDPTLLTASMKAEKTKKWRVHLVDEKERANKNPPWISVTVQSNQLAKIEVVFPKRDVQVSKIQEMSVEAKVSDDLGVLKSGASFSIGGKIKEVIFKHGITAPAKPQAVKEMLTLETEDAEPRQLVSYHFWAEDTGPKGEVRRAMSDMFFAEVREFEDIFREGEAPPGKPEKKTTLDKLVELQKQVVNATWRIVRDTNAGKTMEAAAPDVTVVRESQAINLEQTKEVMEEVEDSQLKNTLSLAWKSMKDALDPLEQAADQKKRASLNQALTFEQSALEWLHQAQSREHQVVKSKSKSPPSDQDKKMQNQVMNLELKQEEKRYEEEKQASEEQTAEQQENLQVLNRLKELARRQEALAEKIKELQKQLDKAKTEQEKDELNNQLKRLEEEQKQLLADLDDLKERMEKPENTANMAEAKAQLEQTREQVNDAAEKLKKQQLTEAANSATRAQRDLEKMQEDFKEKTAKRFSDEMKQMRQQAREVAEKQKQIAESLENQKTPDANKSDTSADLEKMLQGGDASRQIQEQQEKVTQLLENMKRVSEQAEGNNPLLHRRLYEAVREAKTGGLEEHLDEARTQSRYGERAEAQDAERKANTLVEQLQKGVEKAAESVLGSETEALRMARTELDKLIKEAGEEGQSSQAGQDKQDAEKAEGDAKAQASANTPEKGGKPSEDSKGESKAAGKQPGDKPAETAGKEPREKGSPSGQPSEQGQKGERKEPAQMAGNEPGQSPSQGKEPGDQQAKVDANQQGQGGQKGQKPGESPGEAKGAQPGESPQTAQGEGKEGAGGKQGVGEKSGETGQGSQSSSASPKEGSMQLATNPSPKSSGGREGRSSASGGGGNEGGDFFFDQGAEVANDRPFTGQGYDQWTDRLRNVEELLNQPELRNEAAKVLDNARTMRIDHERNDAAPQVDHLQMRILNPLVELRDRVVEELAKRDTKNPMVPVDRDPVPPAFRELVKRYYKELGNGN